MSTFTKFAVVGAGGLGSTVVDGLLKANAAVTILTRDDTKVCNGNSIDGPQIMKQKVRDLLRELDLPSALFHSGLWADFLGNFMEGTINVIGDGNGKMSIVSRSDLGRFMVHVLTTASKPSLTWSRFSVESDRMSPNEIAAVAEKKLGKKLKINVVSYDETKKNYDTDAVANILTNIADGRLVTGTEEEAKDTVAKFFPEWDPTPYEAFIA
ncbi:unnamed protein product [Phytophthora lilii]|uniref:Unnamed protein product n=1 Tax=Phytophthora lilii TaxID=2077276 RepID=A0A9W7CJF7_9STRA|nr:unnamed protein product [Phytophthora lilii]